MNRLLSVWIVLAAIGPAAAAKKEEVRLEFDRQQFDNALLVPSAAGTARLLVPQDDGLHLRCPPGTLVNNAGFSPRFRIRGDFEIIAEFAVVRATRPTAGFGAGAVIQLTTAAAGPPTAVMGRLHRVDGRQIFSAYLATGAGEDRQGTARFHDSQTARGRFRLTRADEILRLAISEADGEFRQLLEGAIGTEDVTYLRFGAQQSQEQADVDVIWKQVDLRADAFPDMPSKLAAGERQHRPRYQVEPESPVSHWWWCGLCGASLTLLAGAWWWHRQSTTL